MVPLEIIYLLFFSASAFGAAPKKKVSKNDGKIVGGSETQISQVPYQVSLQYKGRHICGGAIIDSRHILTAAHCINQADQRDLSIRAGSRLHASGGEVHKVQKVISHPNYDRKTTNNDIAVLELEKPIRASSGARAIGLAQTEPTAGSEVLVSGWGALREGFTASKTLQSVKVPAISRELCQRMYLRYNTVTDRMWCAGYQEGGKDACQGDSGGPAVVNGRLAGVVSWGAGCARRNSPGVYTNIAKFNDWISRQTNTKRNKQ